uniref:Adaptor related protein complex 3 subunit beta 1 n=1 Tax=Nothobranchius furzeri TaxID=105023 RepID=A0A8C6KQI6_NOTFU
LTSLSFSCVRNSGICSCKCVKQPQMNEDLKEMLESNKESLKLEAMKRIVGLISKGKNASELFPAVVKNVASKNIELKKLVYVYLVRYAEEQQDLALLSISTFQRALKKEQLIEVIEKLLKDKSTLVAGSVVVAFEEVCPDRIDLIHKNFRKLCNLLVDVEEWGQVVIINMLTRYARTQFTSPWREDAMFDENNEKAFYDSDSEEKKGQADVKTYIMDPDHRLLLRNTKPLLQSRNTAVVMAVAQLYWHLAPKHEVSIVTKSLVRLLRSHRYIVVAFKHCYNLLSKQGMFEPYMKSFYVRSTDSTHIKTLKLEILTNLANEANISTILREFQTYVKSQDKAFAAATIQAIGRCATNISEVTDTCLNGLVLLLSNRDESVVAESVVVIKKLLQTQPNQHSDIISHMAKLFDNITVPMARASILWLMGEYCERVPKIAPDVLRKMAKTFTVEEDIVKLQTVNLAAKLFLTNSKQTKLLTQYILNLGKYDQNYDIRDRTRFIRQLIVPSEKSSTLNKYARRILLASKPAPVLESAFKDRDRFQLGTLSHSLNIKTSGYQELSEWPAVAPDPSVRNVEVIEPVKEWAPSVGKAKQSKSEDKFYSDDEEKEENASDSSSSDDSDSSSSSSEGLVLCFCFLVVITKQAFSLQPQSYQGNHTAWSGKMQRALFFRILSHTLIYSFISAFLMSCQVTTPSFGPMKTFELLHHMTGKGLSAKYHFPRQPCLYQPSMVSVQVILTNGSDHTLEEIHVGDRSPASLHIHCFNTIGEFLTVRSVPRCRAQDTCTSVQYWHLKLFCYSASLVYFQRKSVLELYFFMSFEEEVELMLKIRICR